MSDDHIMNEHDDEPETTDISLQQLIQQNYNLLDEDDGPLSVSLPNARSLDDIRPLLEAFRFMNRVQRVPPGFRRSNERNQLNTRIDYPDSDDDIDLIDAENDQVSSDDSSDEEDDRTTTMSDESYEGLDDEDEFIKSSILKEGFGTIGLELYKKLIRAGVLSNYIFTTSGGDDGNDGLIFLKHAKQVGKIYGMSTKFGSSGTHMQ